MKFRLLFLSYRLETVVGYIGIVEDLMAQEFTTPFLHYSIPNFLSEESYARIVDAYSKLQFMEKESDLFHFFQTNQLVDEPSVAFFKDELNRQMGKLVSLENSSYNIFASYYFKGDYLLCHDDVIEDRKFAFSYYLEDHPSAELVLYDNTATKIVKQIKVVKNLLVIFEVSNISYHQVAYSTKNGRKAVTGWLNIKGMGSTRVQKTIQTYKPSIPSGMAVYPLDIDVDEEEFYHLPEIEYQFEAEQEKIEGPFYERKLTRLQLENYVTFGFKGYEVYSVDFYKFNKGDYILLNDSINNLGSEIHGQDVLDVFILQRPEDAEDSQDYAIEVVDETGNVGGIPYVNNSVFIVHRNKKNYFVERTDKEFCLGHIIYRKVHKGKKKTAPKVAHTHNRSNIRKIRQELIKKKNEERDEDEKRVVQLGVDKSKQINKNASKAAQHKKKGQKN